MNKTICGIVVDEKYFKEFMERNFKVLDKTVKANIVEIYATSRDYAENAPEYTEAAQKVREQIRAEIQAYYAPNGNRIDKATVDLLNSGIKLKAAEVDKLLAQFYNSPTMLRILGDYSTKNGLDKESRAVSYSHVARGYGAGEKRIFNQVADFVNSAVELGERRAWVLEEKGRNDGIRMIDGAIAEMDGYFVRP